MTFDNKYGNAIEYLLAKGNVAVRYRVMTELLDNASSEDIHKLLNELIISERYVKLIDYLKKRKEYHGATVYAIENSLNMLVDMGVLYDSGFDEFDQVVKEIADEVREKQIDNNHVLRYLPHIVAIASLLRAGIYDEYLMEFVIQFMILQYINAMIFMMIFQNIKEFQNLFETALLSVLICMRRGNFVFRLNMIFMDLLMCIKNNLLICKIK